MLHGIKLAMSRRDEKAIVGNDEKIATVTNTLADLQTWFPQLQAAVEDNEQIWCKLGFNLHTVSSTAREIYAEDNPMQMMLANLQSASTKVVRVDASEDLDEQRRRASTELRDFNERIRAMKLLHTDCVQTLKNKDYYKSKVESMRLKESEKKKTLSDREVEKRLRNEQKLNEVSGELNFKSDKLGTELDELVTRKEQVLGLVLESYVHTQNFYFGRNPMPQVLASMPSNHVPNATFGGSSPGHNHGPQSHGDMSSQFDTFQNGGMGQPPRPPSPDFSRLPPATKTPSSSSHGGNAQYATNSAVYVNGDMQQSTGQAPGQAIRQPSSGTRGELPVAQKYASNPLFGQSKIVSQNSLEGRFATPRTPSAPLADATYDARHNCPSPAFYETGAVRLGKLENGIAQPIPGKDLEYSEGEPRENTSAPPPPPAEFY